MGNNKNKTKPIYSVFAKKLNHLNQKKITIKFGFLNAIFIVSKRVQKHG